MAWYKELGFANNPLDSRPNSSLIGLDDQFNQLRNHVEKEEVCFLNGLTGSGKSSLLKKLQEELKSHKIIYLDAQDLPENFNLEEELKNKRGFFDKIMLRNYPNKKPILIIDEFQATDPNLVLESRAKWENEDTRKIRSIVIAQISPTLSNVTPSFKERIGNRSVQTRVLDDEEMKDLLKNRLQSRKGNFFEKLSDEAVDLIIHCADGNPRRFLEYADLLFDFHHRKFKKVNPILHKQDYKITYWGAKEILQLNKVNVSDFEEKRKYGELKQKRKTTKSLHDLFSKDEVTFIKFLMTGAKTLSEICAYFGIKETTARHRIKRLRQKQAIVVAGKNMEKQKLWRVAPHIRRLTVKV